MMVVIVEFVLREGAESDFATALQQMQEQVKKYDGFLGEMPCRSLDNENKFITLFFWTDRESIKAWREDPVHMKIQQLGRDKIFSRYKIRVCELEREYGWKWSE